MNSLRVFSLPLIIASGLALVALTSHAAPFEVKVTGTGKPMILIPGLACSGEVWNETVSYYQETYECHVVTLAGFAGVPSVGGPFLEIVRDSLLDYIRRNQLEKPVVIGHSLGGFIALGMATKDPDRIGKLVIVDSYPFAGAIFDSAMTAEAMRPQASAMRQMIAAQPRDQYRQSQPAVLATMMRDSSRIATVLRWGMASDPATTAQAMFELFTTDLRRDVALVECPVLVLGSWVATRFYGGSIEKTADNLRAQYRLMPDVRIAVAETARHFIMFDDLPWMVGMMDRFLNIEISKN